MSLFAPHVSTDATHQFRAAENIRQGQGAINLYGRPDVVHPVLLTAVATLLTGFIPADVVFKGIFALGGTLAACLMARFAARLYGGWGAAWWTAAVWAALPCLTSILLLSPKQSLLLLCLAAAFWHFANIAEGSRAAGDFAGAGAWGGLAYLAREEGLMYFPLWFAACWWMRRGDGLKWKWLLCVACFSCMAVGQVLYIHHYTGNFSLSYGLYATMKVETTFEGGELGYRIVEAKGDPESFWSFLRHNGPELAKRIFDNGRAALAVAGSLPVFPAFLFLPVGLGVFGTAWRGRQAGLHMLTALALVPTAGHLLFHIEPRYFAPFVMFLAVWFAGGMEHIRRFVSGQVRWRKIYAAAAGGVMAFLLLTVWVHLATGRKTAHVEWTEAGEWLKRHAPPHAYLLASNDIIAFYSGLRWTTLNPLGDGDESAFALHPVPVADVENFFARDSVYAALAESEGKVQYLEEVLGSEADGFAPGRDFGRWKHLTTVAGAAGNVHIYAAERR